MPAPAKVGGDGGYVHRTLAAQADTPAPVGQFAEQDGDLNPLNG
jgi:hypothetical protein